MPIARFGMVFLSKLELGSYNVSIAKTAIKKIGTFTCFIRFLFYKVAQFISINLPYSLECNNVMLGFMLLAATLICYISCREGYVGLLVLHLLPLLTPSLTFTTCSQFKSFQLVFLGGCSTKLVELVSLPLTLEFFGYKMLSFDLWYR